MSDHRTSISPRSGDDHVIGADGELRNVEQEARDAAVAGAAPAAPRKGRAAPASPETEQDG
jgi:hypothetical protein